MVVAMPTGTEASAKALQFIQGLHHAKGRWAGKPFRLLPWQADRVIKPLFGTLRSDGTRQYRSVYIEIPRKNGKSSLAAAIALYMLCADGEMGGEIYGAAVDRDQAGIVFDTAAAMVRATPMLASYLQIIDSRKRIINPKTSSFYRVIAADAAGSHGFNASAVVLDEMHTQPNRDLYDVLVTSTGSRRQPIIFMITTAGFDRNSICYEMHDYGLKVANGVIDDPSFLPVIYSAAEGDNWLDPAIWRKVNPSLGETVSEEYLAEQFKRAQETPAYENAARRLFLNQWTRQDTRWMPLAAWDGCGGALDVAGLAGRSCYAGVDLASTTDLATLCLLFADGEGGYDVLWHCWIPEATIELRTRRDRVPYETWERAGYVTATEGNVIDYRAIKAKIIEYASLYRIFEVGYDPWNATQFVLELQDEGFTVTPVRQGFASLSAPTKELQKIVLGQRLRHGDNPVARWCADNMVVMTDPAGNLKPAKDKSTEKIDALVALIIALDRATRNENGPSMYETEEIKSWG